MEEHKTHVSCCTRRVHERCVNIFDHDLYKCDTTIHVDKCMYHWRTWWNCNLDENISSADTHLHIILPQVHCAELRGTNAILQICSVWSSTFFWEERKDCHRASHSTIDQNPCKCGMYCHVMCECVLHHPCFYIICVLLNSFWRSDGRNTKKREAKKKRMWKRHKILSFVLKVPPKAQSDQTILSLSEQCTIKKEIARKTRQTIDVS